MATTRKKQAAKKQAAPAINVAPIISWVSLVLAVGLHLLHLPGGILWWLGLLIASTRSVAPELTGQDDAKNPIPANTYEEGRLRKHRARRASWKPLILVSRSVFPWWPLPTVWALAVLIGVATWRLPTFAPIPGWLSVIEGVMVALAVISQCGMWRDMAGDPVDPMPQVSVGDLAVRLVKGPVGTDGFSLGKHLPWTVLFRIGSAVSILLGAAIGFATWGLLRAVFPIVEFVPLLGYVPSAPPEPQTVDMGVLIGLGVLATWRAWVRRDVLAAWRDRVRARNQWKEHFHTKGPKLPTPDLLTHEVTGSGAVVDTFSVPGTQKREDYVKLADDISTLLQPRGSSLFGLPVLEDDGQGGKIEAKTKFRMVTWPPDTFPDLTSNDTTDEAAGLFVESVMSEVTDQKGQGLLELTRITTGKSPAPAWQSTWMGDAESPVGALREQVGQISRVLGVQALIDDSIGELAFGALLDEGTVFDEEKLGGSSERIRQVYQDLADFDMWERAWTQVMGGSQKTPTYRPESRLEASLVDGTVVHMAAFVLRQGNDPGMYYGKEDKLATAIQDAPLVSIQPFIDMRHTTSTRTVRHAQAVTAVYVEARKPDGSASRVPQTPADVVPERERSAIRGPVDASAQKLVLAAQVAKAFTKARLAPPLVTSARPLSDPRARKHVWQLALQLEDATFADVLKKAPSIRQALGVPWLRMEATAEGARLFAGAVPTPRIVSDKASWGKTIDLDWADAWNTAGVVGSDGATPSLIEADPIDGNPDVVRAQFELPGTVSMEKVKGNRSKLEAARGLAFLEIQGTKDPQVMLLEFSQSDPVPFPAPTDFEALAHPAHPEALTFGVGYDGMPRAFVPERDVSLFILGMAGSGKSATIQSIVAAAVARGYLVAVIDPQKGGVDFAFADDWLVAPRAKEPEDALATLKALYAEGMSRKALHDEHSVGNWRKLPEGVRRRPVLVMVDEFTSLVMPDQVPAKSKNPTAMKERAAVEAKNATKAQIGTMIGRFLRELRSVGFSTLLGTQKLDAKTLAAIPGASDAKANASRMILGNPSFGEMASALKRPTEAPKLPDDSPVGRGRFEPGSGRTEMFQSYFAEQPDLAAFLRDGDFPKPTPEQLLDVDAFRPEEAPEYDTEVDAESGLIILSDQPYEEPVEVSLDFSDMDFDDDGDEPVDGDGPEDPAGAGDEPAAAAPEPDAEVASPVEHDPETDGPADAGTPADADPVLEPAPDAEPVSDVAGDQSAWVQESVQPAPSEESPAESSGTEPEDDSDMGSDANPEPEPEAPAAADPSEPEPDAGVSDLVMEPADVGTPIPTFQGSRNPFGPTSDPEPAAPPAPAGGNPFGPDTPVPAAKASGNPFVPKTSAPSSEAAGNPFGPKAQGKESGNPFADQGRPKRAAKQTEESGFDRPNPFG